MKRYYLSRTQLGILKKAAKLPLWESEMETGGKKAAYRSLEDNGLIADAHITEAGHKALEKGYIDKRLPEWEVEFEAQLEQIMRHHSVIRAEAIRIAVREYVKHLQE